MDEDPIVEIIAVTYGHDFELKCFINSILCQTSPKWELHIVHDGLNEEYLKISKSLQKEGYLKDDRIRLSCTKKRENCFGHNCRDFGIQSSKSIAPYTLITNCDNYYVPILVEQIDYYMRDDKLDFLYWDFIHNFKQKTFNKDKAYEYIKAKIKYEWLDIGCAAVNSEICKKIGFKNKEWDSDYYFLEDCIKEIKNRAASGSASKPGWKSRVRKIDKVLFVHN